MHQEFLNVTVDLVIFVFWNFSEFFILQLFTKFRIREFSFFIDSAFLIIIRKFCPPREN